MTIQPLRPLLLERFYAKWEFAVRHNLSASDPEPLSLNELLELADPEARALWNNLTLGYIEPHGNPLLRSEVAAHYSDIASSEIALTVGAQEALFLLMRSLVEPGDHAVVITPAYQMLYAGIRAVGGTISQVPLEPTGSGWSLDMDRLLESLDTRTTMLVINFPHNPTGYLPARSEYESLLRNCDARGIRVLSDEVFRGLEARPVDRLPAAVEVSERAISVGDLSKSYGLAGLRVGWIACRDPSVLEQVAICRDYTTICGSGPSHVLALMALRAREQIQGRAREIVDRNVAFVSKFFASFPDHLDWLPPQAGTTSFPRLRRGSVESLCECLASDAGVLLAPGSLFETGGGHFRLGLGHSNMKEGLHALGRTLSNC